MVNVSILDCLDETGEIDIKKIPEDVAFCIKKFTSKRTYSKDGSPEDTVSIEFYDKLKALEMLGKHAGMFHDREGLGLPVNLQNTTLVINLPEGK